MSRLLFPITYKGPVPKRVAGLRLWLDGKDETTVTVQTGVSNWQDKSGFGNHATQATAGSQPAYASGTVTFDGADDYMILNSAGIKALTQPFTIIMVATVEAGAITAYSLDGIDAGGRVIVGNGTAAEEDTMWATSYVNSNPKIFTNALRVYTFNGASSTYHRNGFLVASGNAGNNDPDNGLHLAGSNSLALKSAIAVNEMLIFNRVLNALDRAFIEDYLMRKWSLTNFNPDQVEGLALWLDANDSTTITEATGVSVWADKSSNKNNAVQGTGANQPDYTSLRYVDFNGSTDIMDMGQPASLDYTPGTDGISIFVVFDYDAATGYLIAKAGNTANQRTGLFLNTTYQTAIGGTTTDVGAITNGLNVVSIDVDASTGKLYENNVEIGDITVGSNTNVVDWTIGGRRDADVDDASSGFLYNGQIYEVIVYDRRIPENQRVSVTNYLMTKWNIS